MISESVTHDRIPPHSIEAEMAVLGSILVDPEIFGAVSGIVAGSDFYAHVHETLFSTIAYHVDERLPLDKVSLADTLRVRGQLERVGNVSYLSALMNTVQTAGSAIYYARLIREKATLRAMIHAATNIARLGFEGESDVAGALDVATAEILAIATRDVPATTDAYDIASDLARELREGVQPGIQTGFTELDRFTRGLYPGRLYLLGARPGMGKTSFALSLSQRVASDGGGVLFASAEMSARDLMQRMAAAEAQLDLRQLTTGELTSRETDRAMNALRTLGSLPLSIDDSVTTIEHVVASARRHHARSALSLLVVDYVQLLGAENVRRDINTVERVGHISRRLKLLAKELSVPVVALTQLNRDLEKRVDKRPILADLRESGSLEQDADAVMFLYREAVYDDDVDPGRAELLIRKNRYGPTGAHFLRWLEVCARFENANIPA